MLQVHQDCDFTHRRRGDAIVAVVDLRLLDSECLSGDLVAALVDYSICSMAQVSLIYVHVKWTVF